MKCRSYCAGLALFSVALPLMTTSLSGQQVANAKNSSGSEKPFESKNASNRNSNEMCGPPATAAATASMETTVACMAQAALQNQTHLRPYTVTREYELFGQKREKTRSRVIATVTFLPGL